MEEYEYKVEDFKEYHDNTLEELEVHLDILGKDGWRLVAIDEGKYIFVRKRQKVSSPRYYSEDRY